MPLQELKHQHKIHFQWATASVDWMGFPVVQTGIGRWRLVEAPAWFCHTVEFAAFSSGVYFIRSIFTWFEYDFGDKICKMNWINFRSYFRLRWKSTAIDRLILQWNEFNADLLFNRLESIVRWGGECYDNFWTGAPAAPTAWEMWIIFDNGNGERVQEQDNPM